jgi:YD repeat-containing protein
LTKVAYPDSTTFQINYTNLDVTSTVDRLSRSTNYVYDALRHLTSVTDPANRATTFNWCMCGAMNWMKGWEQ